VAVKRKIFSTAGRPINCQQNTGMPETNIENVLMISVAIALYSDINVIQGGPKMAHFCTPYNLVN